MIALVTGATGFIGRFMVKTLADKGCDVICMVRNQRKAEMFEGMKGVRLVFADINDSEIRRKLPSTKIDVIFNCMGYVEHKPKFRLYEVNVLGTENICRLALELEVERLVHLSSIAVVNGNDVVPLIEDLPYKAKDLYGESKIEAEKKINEFRKKGLKAVMIRPCMVYGESEPHLLGLLLWLLRFRLLPLLSVGDKKMHLVSVRNVCEAMFFSLTREEFLEGAFNIADNEVLTIKEIYTILGESINAPSSWEMPSILEKVFFNIPYAGGTLKSFWKDRVFSIEKIKSLGFTPVYSPRDGLARAAKYWLKYRGMPFSFNQLENL